MKKQYIVFAIIVILVLLSVFQTNSANKEELPQVGFKAPEFSLQALDSLGLYGVYGYNKREINTRRSVCETFTANGTIVTEKY